jgi:rhamnogalacturonyl hydrolase YesR
MKIIYFIALASLGLSACSSSPNQENPSSALDQAVAQLDSLRERAVEENLIPRTVKEDGTIRWIGEGYDWTEGFFPGTCWYLYSYTNDEKWAAAARQLQAIYEEHKNLTSDHDLGFIFNCSYGNGYRITGNPEFREVVLQAARSLSQRFNPTVGSIQSWNVENGWQSMRGWKFPVIVDNLMNLELLFEATMLSGDSSFWDIAVAHANTTLKNHFREDNSSYHVLDYDPETGEVRSRETAQGFSNESAWARGQAWGLYGFTICYRYTKDEKYLNQALEIARFILDHPNLPEDKVPYWDFNAPSIPDEPRDASAAAIIASALLELADQHGQQQLRQPAEEILASLSSDNYMAEPGSNNHFVLKHSVGSIPHGAEIDVPLNYADYYFIEALMRKDNKGKMAVAVTQ